MTESVFYIIKSVFSIFTISKGHIFYLQLFLSLEMGFLVGLCLLSLISNSIFLEALLFYRNREFKNLHF